MVGHNTSQVIDCYAKGNIAITDSAPQINIGGLIGSNGGVVSSSFWDTQTSGLAESAGGTGRPTAQMQTLSTYTDAGWDFDAVWYMCRFLSYLHLPQSEVPNVSA